MLSKDEAYRLTRFSFADLSASAQEMRDSFSSRYISFSPKVFIPLTQLCRDACSYCTFAQTPTTANNLYMTLEEVVDVCAQGRVQQCAEALFTLGEAPELRYEVAQQWLLSQGYQTTVDYLVDASHIAMTTTGLLPHVNPGAISDNELTRLKAVSASQGMMLESIAGRLCEPGGPHWAAPDKTPARRLATLEAAGRSRVPFTTGILVGIGETRLERIEALLAIRDLHQRYGHVQEVIIQNFLPKQSTGMASAPPCDEEEHLWSIAAARLVFQTSVHIQAPPNLASSVTKLIEAGIDDLGGISPVTIDYVNPEKPWPHLASLHEQLYQKGKLLRARCAIYPEYITKEGFVHENVAPYIAHHVDSEGYLKHSLEK